MALIKLIAEHLIPSALIGFTAYWLTGQGHLITIALLTGWLIDSDHFSYSLNIYTYFLSFRIYKKFDINAITKKSF